MTTIIVIDRENPGASQGAIITQAKAAGCNDILFVKANNQSALKNAIDYSKPGPILLLSGILFATTAEIAKLLQLRSNPNEIQLVSYFHGDDYFDSSPTTLAGIYKMLEGQARLPLLACIADRELLRGRSICCETPNCIIASLAIQGISDGTNVSVSERVLDISSYAKRLVPILSTTERAVLLRFLLANCNLEEIFPNNPWSEHPEESAALCFHRLAGLFMNLEDPRSASDCLDRSDQFEDSPRSLAIKGIICEQDGRTLEAVAQLVSSLQKYEIRKKENAVHYVSFTPRNLERINQSLHEGLDALNKRDNKRAFQLFSQAVYDFDPFFEEFGMATGKLDLTEA